MAKGDGEDLVRATGRVVSVLAIDHVVEIPSSSNQNRSLNDS